jgi:hypothetical protein
MIVDVRARYRILVLGIVAAALVGCDPYPVPSEPDHADLYVDYNATGGASVMLMLGGHSLTSTQLLNAGQAIAPVLFDHRGQETTRVDKQEKFSGYPFIRIGAADVYAVGPHAVVNVDTEAALSLLVGMGYRSVYVDVSAPDRSDTAVWRDPPDTAESGQWSWNAAIAGHAAPAGVITIVRSPASHSSSRNLARAGWIAVLIVFIAAVGFLVPALATRPRRKIPIPAFNPPPGWPTPPPGWTPPVGWQPDPNWPPAPTDWRFFA